MPAPPKAAGAAGSVYHRLMNATPRSPLPPPPGAKYFDALVSNIEKLFETGQPPYPVERTLLTTGILDAAMESHHRRGERVETPELNVRYTAPLDSGFLRGNVSAPA